MLICAMRHRIDLRPKQGERHRQYGTRLDESVTWAAEQFGYPGYLHTMDKDDQEDESRAVAYAVGGHWTISGAVFLFEKQADAIAFKLRWL